MPSHADIMGRNPNHGSIVRPIDLSSYPEHSKVMLKAIVVDMQLCGAHEVVSNAFAPKCFVVFHGAGPYKSPRVWSKTKRMED